MRGGSVGGGNERAGSVSRTCGDCGSSWDGRATFCGRCGGLLDDALATRGTPDRGMRRWWRPWVGALGVAVVVGGAVAAVPRLSIERTPPVAGEIGVPEEDDLNAAPASTRTRDRVPDPPEVSCSVDDEPVACVRWSRAVLSPAGFERSGGWAAPVGDTHLLAAGHDGFAVFDVTSGARLWRDASLAPSYPLDVTDGGVMVDGPAGTSYRGLDDGTVWWSSPTGSGLLGGVIVDDVGVLGEHDANGDTTLRGRRLHDGAVVWERGLSGALHMAGELPGGRVFLEPADGQSTHVVVDAPSGEVVSRFDAPRGWLAGHTQGIAFVVSESTRDPADPNLAGDGGATLTAVRLDDGTTAWTRALPSSQMPVSIADGTVLSESTDRVVALEATTGDVRWELDLAGSFALAHHGAGSWWGLTSGNEDWSPVAVVHDQADDLVRAHDLVTGEVVWERSVDEETQHVFATGDIVMAHRQDGATLLDPTTGDERLSVALSGGHVAGWDPLTVVHPPSGHVTVLDVPGVDVP